VSSCQEPDLFFEKNFDAGASPYWDCGRKFMIFYLFLLSPWADLSAEARRYYATKTEVKND
jgi:hypothetical protein